METEMATERPFIPRDNLNRSSICQALIADGCEIKTVDYHVHKLDWEISVIDDQDLKCPVTITLSFDILNGKKLKGFFYNRRDSLRTLLYVRIGPKSSHELIAQMIKKSILEINALQSPVKRYVLAIPDLKTSVLDEFPKKDKTAPSPFRLIGKIIELQENGVLILAEKDHKFKEYFARYENVIHNRLREVLQMFYRDGHRRKKLPRNIVGVAFQYYIQDKISCAANVLPVNEV